LARHAQEVSELALAIKEAPPERLPYIIRSNGPFVAQCTEHPIRRDVISRLDDVDTESRRVMSSLIYQRCEPLVSNSFATSLGSNLTQVLTHFAPKHDRTVFYSVMALPLLLVVVWFMSFGEDYLTFSRMTGRV